MRKYLVFSLWFLLMGQASAAKVYFVKPTNGEHVKGPNVKVVFGLTDWGIAPAGIKKKNTGHHHLLVDFKGKLDIKKPLPAGKNLIHFGGGQTETVLKNLKKGEHKLRLILGDFAHRPHNPPLISNELTIIVD